MKDMLPADLQGFLKLLLPSPTPLEEEIFLWAQEHHVSIVEREVGGLLRLVTGLSRPLRVLELGTGIGYSTLHIAQSLNEDGKIFTIERVPERSQKARYFLEKGGYAARVEFLVGDGREMLKDFQEPFDMIFLDAAKGQYARLFSLCNQLLSPGGLIIADNVLINGWVISLEYPERRKKTMVVNMRKFLESFSQREDFEMSLIPLGDGVAIFRKR